MIVEGQIFITHVFHICSPCIPDDTGRSLFVHSAHVNHRYRRPGGVTVKCQGKKTVGYISVGGHIKATFKVDYFVYFHSLFTSQFINIIEIFGFDQS